MNDDDGTGVVAFVDGYNFYRGLSATFGGLYKWLDFETLFTSIVGAGETLRQVVYFTAPAEHDRESHARQQVYWRALETRPLIRLRKGVFERRPVKCPKCSQRYRRPHEKQTDVNMATELILGALDGDFAKVLLCTGDSDLIPAVRAVRERFGTTVTVVDPPGRGNKALRDAADDYVAVTEAMLVASQLDRRITVETRRRKPRHYFKPDEWL